MTNSVSIFHTLGQWFRGSDLGSMFKFAVVGGIGFCVDGGLLLLLADLTTLGPYLSRFVSFPTALTVTWYLNRRWTFCGKLTVSIKREYAAYIFVQSVGALVNLAVYLTAILVVPNLRMMLLLPLSLGALAGLIVNYFGAKHLVFVSVDDIEATAKESRAGESELD
jgi:putative flippase GtrA